MADTEDESGYAIRPNKSQLKREAQALLALVKQLEALSARQWRDAALPEHVVDALCLLKTMKQDGAKKRQLKLIARYLRDIDTSDAEQMVAASLDAQREHNRLFHRVERWRDKLLREGDSALAALVAEYPGVDTQAIRQLLRNARREEALSKPAKAAKTLFKLLREVIH